MRLDLSILILRVGVGAFMLFGHGWNKLMGFSKLSGVFPDPLGFGSPFSLALAVFAEVFCSLLILLGIGTRLATIPLIITMLVVAFMVHGSDPFAKKELALMYLMIYSSLLFSGSGKFSVQYMFMHRKSPKNKLAKWFFEMDPESSRSR